MKTSTEKYLNDPYYKNLVDSLAGLIEAERFTPFELSEAVVFAATKAEMFRAKVQAKSAPPQPYGVANLAAGVGLGGAGREPGPPPPPTGPLSAISSPTGEHPGPTADCKRGFHQGHPDCIHCGAPRVT